MTKYIACICEGGAETAIMNMLLDQNKLIFSRDELLEGELCTPTGAAILKHVI